MSEFRNIVESIFKESGIGEEIDDMFQFYANELQKKGIIKIKDESEVKEFEKYCKEHEEDIPFDSSNLYTEYENGLFVIKLKF